MPMDRLTRTLVGCGLAMIVSASGCKSTRDEVPPGRGFRQDGRQEPAVGFSMKPHDPQPGAYGNPVGAGSRNAVGGPSIVPPTAGNPYGESAGKFGGPGTSGLGRPPGIASPGSIAADPAGPAPTYPPRPTPPPDSRSLINEATAAPAPF